MGGAGFPPCLLFGLRRPSTGGYRLFGVSNGGLQEGSCQGVLPRTSAASVLVPSVSHSHPPPLRILFPTALCVPSKSGVSASPVLSKSWNQIPLAFKVQFPGNSSSCCRTPRLGSLTWGSEPSLQWVEFCGIIVLQFVSHPPSGYGIWSYCDCTPPTVSFQLLLCLWMWVSFLVSSSVFLLMIVQQLVVILVLSQKGVSGLFCM